MSDNPQPKSRRGFASMTPEKQREIASKGGRAAAATVNRSSANQAAGAGMAPTSAHPDVAGGRLPSENREFAEPAPEGTSEEILRRDTIIAEQVRPEGGPPPEEVRPLREEVRPLHEDERIEEPKMVGPRVHEPREGGHS